MTNDTAHHSGKYIRGWTPLPIRGLPKISMAIATYEQRDELACLLYSFRAQTWPNWEAVVVHDGPGRAAREVVERIDDPRIKLVETAERKQSYGHPWRELGISSCSGDYIGLTNGDNYYAPVFFEWMLHTLTVAGADLAYCDFLHSHQQWAEFRSGTGIGLIDLGCFVGAANLFKTTPWTEHGFLGDGVFFEAVHRKAAKAIRIPRPLFVHN